MAKRQLQTLAKTTVRLGAYCRYSSKNQSAESAADQLKLIRLSIKRRDLPSTKYHGDEYDLELKDEFIFMDEAKNGRTTVGRDGYEKFLDCIRSGSVDVVVVHNLSRLCRDLGDQLEVYELVKYKGIELISLSDYLSSENPQARQSFIFKGMINEFGNDVHAKQTKRGLTARVLEGYSAGDICYGYRSVPTKTRMRGNLSIPSHNRIEIYEDEASNVRLIFKLRLKGYGFSAIANELRKRKIPTSIRSQKISGQESNWSSSSVRKVLTQCKYIGVWVWGKQKSVKNPLTKKFERRHQQQNEWVSHFDGEKRRDDLVIIEQEIWDAVQLTFIKKPKTLKDKWQPARERRISGATSDILLGGLLSCGSCGSNMLQVRSGYIGCYTHYRKSKIDCSNNRTLNYAKLERVVIEQLQRLLLDDSNINLAVKLVNQKVRERLSILPEESRSLIKERASIEKTISNLMKFIRENGNTFDTVANELKVAENRFLVVKERLKAIELAKLDKVVVTSFAIKDRIARLLDLFNTDKVLANSILRKLIPGRLSCTSIAENNSKNMNQFTSRWKIEGDIVIETVNGDGSAIGNDLKSAIKLGIMI